MSIPETYTMILVDSSLLYCIDVKASSIELHISENEILGSIFRLKMYIDRTRRDIKGLSIEELALMMQLDREQVICLLDHNVLWQCNAAEEQRYEEKESENVKA